MSSAKEEILNRIQGCSSSEKGSRASEYAAIQRNYGQSSLLSKEEQIVLFEDRLRDYGTGVFRCSHEEVKLRVAEILNRREKQSLFVTDNVPSSWLPDLFTFRLDGDVSYDELDRGEGVLTTCAVAIAETGTIVLRHTQTDGRRALTLIPDYHLCIVLAEQIVGSVVEGMRKMELFASMPTTTISGPSATSDIEMTRIKGVHGPRFMDVIIVDWFPA